MKLPYGENAFFQCQSPEEILQKAEACQNSISSTDFFNQSGIEYIRDATTAGEFSRMFAQGKDCKVRLLPPPDVDFEILIDDEILRFESTEIDRPGRKRGKEYSEKAEQDSPRVKHVDIEEEEKQAVRAIRLAIKKKSDKHYKPPPHLVVRMNMY